MKCFDDLFVLESLEPWCPWWLGWGPQEALTMYGPNLIGAEGLLPPTNLTTLSTRLCADLSTRVGERCSRTYDITIGSWREYDVTTTARYTAGL